MPPRSRQEWDRYFLFLAKEVGNASHCLSRKIGSVLVRDNRVLSTGYNGPPKSVLHCDYRDDEGRFSTRKVSDVCPRRRMGFESGQGMEFCTAVHAEINSILAAARSGTSTDGTTLYCYCPTPCTECTKEIINAGVRRVVCIEDKESRPWLPYTSKELFHAAGVMLYVIEMESND